MPSHPASLLMVVTEDWYFLSHRLELAKEAARRGLRVTIATGPGERGAAIREAGFEHLVFALDRRSLNVWREVQTLRALTALMRDLRPSLVHLVAAKPIMYGNIAASLAGGPPVLNAVAGLGYLYMGGGVGRRDIHRVDLERLVVIPGVSALLAFGAKGHLGVLLVPGRRIFVCRGKHHRVSVRMHPGARRLSNAWRDPGRVAGLQVHQVDLVKRVARFAFRLKHELFPVAGKIAFS